MAPARPRLDPSRVPVRTLHPPRHSTAPPPPTHAPSGPSPSGSPGSSAEHAPPGSAGISGRLSAILSGCNQDYSIPAAPGRPAAPSAPPDHGLLQHLTQLIQDNNNHTLAFLEGSFRRLFAELLDSIHSHAALEHCNRQLGEINKQFLRNAANLNDEVRVRVHATLTQQKLELEGEKRVLLARPSLQPPGACPGDAAGMSSDPGPGPPVATVSEGLSGVDPALLGSRCTFPTHINPSILSSSAKPKRAHTVAFEYDESLVDGFGIPSNPSRADYALHRLPSGPGVVYADLNDISVIGQPGPVASGSNSHTLSSMSPALVDVQSKSAAASKSSRRQSAILRNLVSAALGKLIAQVTNNQQTHWPGSDTEERLAAMGLRVELWAGSKLSREVLHKGPKNMQLQQCKRILLELQLGLIQLQEIEAIPRPPKKRARAIEPPTAEAAPSSEQDPSPRGDANQDLIQRYIQSNLHPSGLIAQGDEEYTGDEEDQEHSQEDDGAEEASE